MSFPLVPTIVSVLVAIVVAGVGAVATRLDAWYYNLHKPAWQPPDWLFGPAWTTIFALCAAAGVLAWQGADANGRVWVVGLFALNYALNILWSVLFFTLKRPDWGLIEVVPLWLSVIALIVGLAPYSSLAAWLLVPYAVWVGFAAFLNLAIVRLNGPFGATA